METEKKIKTLANCSLVEFSRQAYKICKEVSEYLDKTKLMEISKRLPEKGAEADEKQWKKNLLDMLYVCLDKYAEDTVKVLGLLCFTEGEELEKLTPVDLLDVALETIGSERVLDFFSKLMRSGLIDINGTSSK